MKNVAKNEKFLQKSHDFWKKPHKVLGKKEVFEKFGVKPNQVIDVQSLAGDSSDNIPGVPGIGIKTAAELINKYNNLDVLLKNIEKNLSGKHAVIIGRSNLNGKPMAQLLLKENCSVTISHSKTKNLKDECVKADILIVAVGVPNLVKKDWVKNNSIVIDVGINKLEDKLVGDVKFDEVKDKVKAITPVPGGVGPMTIACLLKNTLECFKGR